MFITLSQVKNKNSAFLKNFLFFFQKKWQKSQKISASVF